MEVIVSRCAGLDVHKNTVMACVRGPGPNGGRTSTVRQFRTFTLPGMAILYLFVPLPMGLAWCRAYFEKEAYAESVRAAAEVWGIDHARSEAYRRRVLDQFTGAAYGWMWPFRAGLERWYDGVLATVALVR